MALNNEMDALLRFSEESDVEQEEQQDTTGIQVAQAASNFNAFSDVGEGLSIYTPPEDDSEDVGEDDESVGEYLGTAAKMGAYGFLRQGVVGTGEFIASTPIWATKLLSGGSRAMTEGARAAFAAFLPKTTEEWISDNVFTGSNNNVFDYVDIFDTQTDIDKFFDQHLFTVLNNGVDIATGGAIDNYFTVKDEQGNVIQGDYGKFMDTVFDGLKVPEEKQNFLGRVLMTGGEFIVPMGLMRVGGRKIGETTADVVKRYTKDKEKIQKRLGERVERKGPRNPESDKMTKMLERDKKRLDEKIKGLEFKQRHYSVGTASAEIGKKLKDTDKTTIGQFLKHEGSMAIGASTAMVSTEYLLEAAGLEEYKGLALISGLAGGVVGISPLINTLTTAKHLTMYGIKSMQAGSFDSVTGVDSGAAYHYLRYRGYSDKSINLMTDEQKLTASVMDPKILKLSKQLGQSVMDIAKQGPEGQKLLEEIQISMEATQRLTKRFNDNLQADVEAGLITGKNADFAAETLPVLLDQVVHLSSLAKIRETLLSNVSVGGITLKANKVAVINELDKIGETLDKQSKLLRKSLEGVQNKIKRDVSQKGITITNPVNQYLDVVRRFAEDYKEIGNYYRKEIDDMRAIKDTDIHPLNNEKFNEDMDAILGEDTLSQAALARKMQEEGSSEQAAEIDSLNKSLENIQIFGNQQAGLLRTSFDDMKRKVDEAYAEVEDYSMDADFLFRNNDALDEMLDVSPTLKIYESTLKGPENRFDLMIIEARKKGLQGLRNEFTDSGKLNEEEYFKELSGISIQHDKAAGRLDSLDKINAEKEKLSELYSVDNPIDSIEALEKQIVNKEILTGQAGNRRLISISREVDGVMETSSAIPLQISFKDIAEIRSRLMSKAFQRQRSTGNMTADHDRRVEIDAFTTILDDKINKFENNLRKSGVDINSYKKLLDANKLYRTTLGASFKRRMGTFLKKQTDSGNRDENNMVPDSQLFQVFFEQAIAKDPLDVANQFKIMFKDLKDENGKDLYPEAKELLLKSLRRYLSRKTGRVSGLQKLDDEFIGAFLKGKDGLNLLEGKTEKQISDFLNWKNKEATHIENSKIGIPFNITKDREKIQEALDGLTEDRLDVLLKSILSDKKINDEMNTDDLIKLIFKNESAYHAARDDISVYKQMAENGDITDIMYRKFLRNKQTVDSNDFAQKYGTQNLDLPAPVSELVGPPVRRGASIPQSPIKILLETFEGRKDYDQIVLSLRGAFVKNLASNAYTFSKSTRRVTEKAGRDGEDYVFELTQDVQLDEFARIMEQNKETIDILWKDDPEQLSRIKDIYNLEMTFKTSANKPGTKLLDTGIQLKASSLMSRVYSISRGVISPKYVATEIAIAKAQADKGTFMLKLLMDPDTTGAVADAMRIVAGDIEATPDKLRKIRKMATTIFFTESPFAQDYPADVKPPSWLKEQLEFIASVSNTLTEKVKGVSRRMESGLDREDEEQLRIRITPPPSTRDTIVPNDIIDSMRNF